MLGCQKFTSGSQRRGKATGRCTQSIAASRGAKPACLLAPGLFKRHAPLSHSQAKPCSAVKIQDSTRGGAASHEAAQRRQCVVQQTWRRFHTSRLSAAEGGEKEGFVSRVCQSPGSGGGAPGEGSGAVPQRGLGQRPSRSATFYALRSQRNAKKSFKNVMPVWEPVWATGSRAHTLWGP